MAQYEGVSRQDISINSSEILNFFLLSPTCGQIYVDVLALSQSL